MNAAAGPASNPPITLWLASKSPRRQAMLREAGIHATPCPADIDDGLLRHGEVPPEWWVMALAFLKARRVLEILQTAGTHAGLVIGADTVCAVGRTVLGQPRDADDARRMLMMMRGREHRTLTGVCLLRLPATLSSQRLVVFDATIVRIGDISDEQIETYVESEHWRGKAGAYNLSERIFAGWPISCVGDPTTVMGLPMRRLPAWLKRAGWSSTTVAG